MQCSEPYDAAGIAQSPVLHLPIICMMYMGCHHTDFNWRLTRNFTTHKCWPNASTILHATLKRDINGRVEDCCKDWLLGPSVCCSWNATQNTMLIEM